MGSTSIDPNAVYETINCRGKQLDDIDLIRNYLYSHFNAEADSKRRNSLHEKLERIRIFIPQPNKASEYIRCHLQCKFGFLRKDYFYRGVRTFIHNQKEKNGGSKKYLSNYVFDLTEQITAKESLELFKTITATYPDPKFIGAFQAASGTTNSRRNLGAFLRELRGYGVTLPLVFVLLNRYIGETNGQKKKRIARLANKNLSRLATFVLRTAFVAPKFEPSHFEKEFSSFAQCIAVADDIPDAEFAEFLLNCDRSECGVLDDRKFETAMCEVRMTGKMKIIQFLLGINGALQRDAQVLNGLSYSVEHILPKAQIHWNGWTGFEDVDQADWTQRIGNLTLLGQADNKPGLKYNFAKKLESYRESAFKLTSELDEYSEWTPSNIASRQRKMAQLAVKVWTFVGA